MYSPSPTKTKKQFIEESKKHLSWDSTHIFFNLIDLKPYENEDGGVNPSEITKKIKNLKLNEITDDVILSVAQKKQCEYYYSFEFENKEFKIPFYIPEEKLGNFKNYEITTDTVGKYKRTISIWNNKNKTKMNSVNFQPLDSELNFNELSIGIRSDSEINVEKLKSFFLSVKLKNN